MMPKYKPNGKTDVLEPPKGHPKVRIVAEAPLHVKFLLCGDPGVGKTYLSATAPNPLLLLAEPEVAMPTLLRVERDRGRRIPYWEIRSMDDLREAYEWLVGERPPYDTIVIDGMTEILHQIGGEIIEEGVARRSSHDPEILEEGDWNRQQLRVRSLVRMFRDLPYHVIITAHQTAVKGDFRIGPWFQPRSLVTSIPAYFNTVGYLVERNQEGESARYLIVGHTEEYIAKSPGGALPPVIKNPDLGELFPQIINALKEESKDA